MLHSEEEIRLEIENLDLRRLLAKAGIDAAELRVAAELQRLLLEELHHRVKNTLATVMAITSQTLRNATSIEQASDAITNRLLTLGRVHDLLLRVNWSSVSLADITGSAIEPYQQVGSRFVLEVPSIDINASAVLPLHLVLNELCTNALKYGALSIQTGRVVISASVDNVRKQLLLDWGESGGPHVDPPSRRGFGSQMIERIVKQLQGQASLVFEPSGVAANIVVPLASLV